MRSALPPSPRPAGVCTRGATLRQWVRALKRIVRARPAARQRKLFHDNAVRFYGLGT